MRGACFRSPRALAYLYPQPGLYARESEDLGLPASNQRLILQKDSHHLFARALFNRGNR